MLKRNISSDFRDSCSGEICVIKVTFVFSYFFLRTSDFFKFSESLTKSTSHGKIILNDATYFHSLHQLIIFFYQLIYAAQTNMNLYCILRAIILVAALNLFVTTPLNRIQMIFSVHRNPVT